MLPKQGTPGRLVSQRRLFPLFLTQDPPQSLLQNQTFKDRTVTLDFPPSHLPTGNFIRPTEELKFLSLRNEEGNEEVCNLVSGVRLKNMSPPMSLKGKDIGPGVGFPPGSARASPGITAYTRREVGQGSWPVCPALPSPRRLLAASVLLLLIRSLPAPDALWSPI